MSILEARTHYQDLAIAEGNAMMALSAERGLLVSRLVDGGMNEKEARTVIEGVEKAPTQATLALDENDHFKRALRFLGGRGPIDAFLSKSDAYHRASVAAFNSRNELARLDPAAVETAAIEVEEIEAVRNEIAEIAAKVNPHVRLKAVHRLTGLEEDGRPVDETGLYDPFRRVVTVALDITRFDPEDKAYQQLWMSLEDVIGHREKKVLDDAFPGASHGADAAKAFSDWVKGRKEPPGLVVSAFRGARNFLGRTGNMLRMRGFQVPEDVFTRALDGKMAQRFDRTRLDTKAIRIPSAGSNHASFRLRTAALESMTPLQLVHRQRMTEEKVAQLRRRLRGADMLLRAPGDLVLARFQRGRRYRLRQSIADYERGLETIRRIREAQREAAVKEDARAEKADVEMPDKAPGKTPDAKSNATRASGRDAEPVLYPGVAPEDLVDGFSPSSEKADAKDRGERPFVFTRNVRTAGDLVFVLNGLGEAEAAAGMERQAILETGLVAAGWTSGDGEANLFPLSDGSVVYRGENGEWHAVDHALFKDMTAPEGVLSDRFPHDLAARASFVAGEAAGMAGGRESSGMAPNDSSARLHSVPVGETAAEPETLAARFAKAEGSQEQAWAEVGDRRLELVAALSGNGLPERTARAVVGVIETHMLSGPVGLPLEESGDEIRHAVTVIRENGGDERFEAFQSAMGNFRGASDASARLAVRMAERESRDGFNPTPKMSAEWPALKREVLTVAARMNPAVRVKFVDDLFADSALLRASGAIGKGQQRLSGMYEGAHPGEGGVATVSLTGADPVNTAYHESFHSIQPLLTLRERSVLQKAFPSVSRLPDPERRLYELPEGAGLSSHERQAYAFAAWACGHREAVSGREERKIFSKMKAFAVRTWNLVNGRGFQTVEDVFRRAERGVVGRRSAVTLPRPGSVFYSVTQYSVSGAGVADLRPEAAFLQRLEARGLAVVEGGTERVKEGSYKIVPEGKIVSEGKIVPEGASAFNVEVTTPEGQRIRLLEAPVADMGSARLAALSHAFDLPRVVERREDPAPGDVLKDTKGRHYRLVEDAPGVFGFETKAPRGRVFKRNSLTKKDMGALVDAIRAMARDEGAELQTEHGTPHPAYALYHPGRAEWYAGSSKGWLPAAAEHEADYLHFSTRDAAERSLRKLIDVEVSYRHEAETAPEPGRSVADLAPADSTVAEVLSDHATSAFNQKRALAGNLEAITLLKQLEEDGRAPTNEERTVLARYVGWGALPGAFNVNGAETGGWTWDERQQVKAALDEREYDAARRSTLNAHYTAKPVVEAMYAGLDRLGVKAPTTGRLKVLEPAVGTGNFIGLMPRALRDRATVTGVELDKTTARVASALYPNDRILQSGFERTALPEGFFDVAVSNVPFADFSPNDRRFAHLKPRLHDYFFLKTAEQLRPGGVMMFVTSAGTLDKSNAAVRQALQDKMEFVSAVRLPGTAFRRNAGTDVVSDIVIMRKREKPLSAMGEDERKAAVKREPKWMRLKTVKDPLGGPDMLVNEYFAAHPKQVVGRLERSGNLHGFGADGAKRMNVAFEGGAKELHDEIRARMERLPSGLYAEADLASSSELPADLIPAPGDVKNGAFFLDADSGDLLRKVDGVGVAPEPALDAGEEAIVKEALIVRDALRDVFRSQHLGLDPGERASRRRSLTKAYDTFVAAHGHFRDRKIAKLLASDPDGPLLAALESGTAKDGFSKARVFFEDTISPAGPVSSAETPAEALAASLNERGRVDLHHMADLLGTTVEDVVEQAQGLIFRDPSHGTWETAEHYLSGDVREKLALARQAAAADPHFAANVTALEAVQPEDIPYHEIEARLGSPWIPPRDIRAFARHMMDSWKDGDAIKIGYNPVDSNWTVEVQGAAGTRLRKSIAARRKWGTKRVDALSLLEKALNGRPIVVTDRIKDQTFVNGEETLAAQMKAIEMKEAFKDWVWAEPDRRERLARLYNDRFNTVRAVRFDGSHLSFPGMAPEWRARIRPHQKDAVWRAVSTGRALFGHEVGTGKTLTQIAAAMEMKRLGLARKPLMAVQGSTIGQIEDAFREIYPAANVFFMPDKVKDAAERRRLMAQIAVGDYDAVVVTHDNLDMLSMTPEAEADYLERTVADYAFAIEEAKREAAMQDGKSDNRIIKQMENARAKLEGRIGELMERGRRDDTVYFEDLGVDALLIDEAHRYKNLAIVSQMRNLKGLPTAASGRAERMAMRTRWLQGQGTPVVFSTGTPVSNTIGEVYNLMRYLQPEELEKRGLAGFDAWSGTFADQVTRMELTAANDYKLTTRLARFVNMPELSQLTSMVNDIVHADAVSDIKRPTPHYAVVDVAPSEETKAFVADLGKRAANLANVDPTEDNMLKISTEGRMAALDLRMVDPEVEADGGGKIDEAVNRIARIYHDNPGKTQLVFSDLGINPSQLNPEFAPIRDMKAKLVAAGIPESEIADFYTATKAQRAGLMEKLNSGEMRIALGGTEKLGTGTNVQQKLIALHHLDAPWLPAAVEQRDGRGLRQGNENSDIYIYRYVTRGTFDAFMWQALDTKSRFINQFMRNDSARELRDEDTEELSPAQVMAIASGNPLLLKKIELEQDVAILERREQRHRRDKAEAEADILRIDGEVKRLKDVYGKATVDAEAASASLEGKATLETSEGGILEDRTDMATVIEQAASRAWAAYRRTYREGEPTSIGMYRGRFELLVRADYAGTDLIFRTGSGLEHHIDMGRDGANVDGASVLRSLDGRLRGLAIRPEKLLEEIDNLGRERETATHLSSSQFKFGGELEAKRAELKRIQRYLGLPEPNMERVEEIRAEGPTYADALARAQTLFSDIDRFEEIEAGLDADKDKKALAKARGDLATAKAEAAAWQRIAGELDPAAMAERERVIPMPVPGEPSPAVANDVEEAAGSGELSVPDEQLLSALASVDLRDPTLGNEKDVGALIESNLAVETRGGETKLTKEGEERLAALRSNRSSEENGMGPGAESLAAGGKEKAGENTTEHDLDIPAFLRRGSEEFESRYGGEGEAVEDVGEPAVEAAEVIDLVPALAGRYVDEARNYFGGLDPALRARLKAVLEDPTPETWNDAYSIVINDRGRTLWQAVRQYDDSFPASVAPGEGPERWEKVPGRIELFAAMAMAMEQQREARAPMEPGETATVSGGRVVQLRDIRAGEDGSLTVVANDLTAAGGSREAVFDSLEAFTAATGRTIAPEAVESALARADEDLDAADEDEEVEETAAAVDGGVAPITPDQGIGSLDPEGMPVAQEGAPGAEAPQARESESEKERGLGIESPAAGGKEVGSGASPGVNPGVNLSNLQITTRELPARRMTKVVGDVEAHKGVFAAIGAKITHRNGEAAVWLRSGTDQLAAALAKSDPARFAGLAPEAALDAAGLEARRIWVPKKTLYEVRPVDRKASLEGVRKTLEALGGRHAKTKRGRELVRFMNDPSAAIAKEATAKERVEKRRGPLVASKPGVEALPDNPLARWGRVVELAMATSSNADLFADDAAAAGEVAKDEMARLTRDLATGRIDGQEAAALFTGVLEEDKETLLRVGTPLEAWRNALEAIDEDEDPTGYLAWESVDRLRDDLHRAYDKLHDEPMKSFTDAEWLVEEAIMDAGLADSDDNRYVAAFDAALRENGKPAPASEEIRIPPKRIELGHWNEGGHEPIIIEGSATPFEDAAEVLARWALDRDLGGGYDKTGFRIEFADGETYEGRLDLMHPTAPAPDIDLSEHMRQFTEAYGGIAKPAHMDEASWKGFLSQYSDDDIAGTARFRTDYALHDDEIGRNRGLETAVPLSVTSPAIERARETARDLQEADLAQWEARAEERGELAWQISRDAFVSDPAMIARVSTPSVLPALHESFVKAALAEGKDVPEDVLADYPKLAEEEQPDGSVKGAAGTERDALDPKGLAATPGNMAGDTRAQPLADAGGARETAGLTESELLAASGLVITQSETTKGSAVWEVTGNTREHKETLRALGGRWYGPKKAWSFYKGDPTADIAAVLGDGEVSASAGNVVAMPKPSVTKAGPGVTPKEKGEVIDGRTFLFERRREGNATFTWAMVWSEKEGGWADMGDPWPGTRWKKENLNHVANSVLARLGEGDAALATEGAASTGTLVPESKFRKGQDTAEVAKAIRGEIAEAQKSGLLPKGKYGVRIRRFAGGAAIDITVKAAEGVDFINPNGQLVAGIEAANRGEPWMSEKGRAVFDTLESIMAQYNRDRSEPMTDYFEVDFYSDVRLDHDLEKTQVAAHRRALEEGKTEQVEASISRVGNQIPPGDAAMAASPSETGPSVSDGGNQFAAWFNGSKVVNERGAPIVVYHGTDARDFDAFERSEDIGFHFATSPESADTRLRHMAADPVDVAVLGANGALTAAERGGQPVEYPEGARIVPAFLSIHKPLRVDDLGTWEPKAVVRAFEEAGVLSSQEARRELDSGVEIDRDWARDVLAEKGFDGLVYANETEGGGDSYIAVHPDQVKSVFARDFDPATPNISASLAGTGTTTEKEEGSMADAASGDNRGTVTFLDAGREHAQTLRETDGVFFDRDAGGWYVHDNHKDRAALIVEYGMREIASAMTPDRDYLQVPFKEKDTVKELGAHWDGKARLWFVPEGHEDPSAFAKWRTEESREVAEADRRDLAERRAASHPVVKTETTVAPSLVAAAVAPEKTAGTDAAPQPAAVGTQRETQGPPTRTMEDLAAENARMRAALALIAAKGENPDRAYQDLSDATDVARATLAELEEKPPVRLERETWRAHKDAGLEWKNDTAGNLVFSVDDDHRYTISAEIDGSYSLSETKGRAVTSLGVFENPGQAALRAADNENVGPSVIEGLDRALSEGLATQEFDWLRREENAQPFYQMATQDFLYEVGEKLGDDGFYVDVVGGEGGVGVLQQYLEHFQSQGDPDIRLAEPLALEDGFKVAEGDARNLYDGTNIPTVDLSDSARARVVEHLQEHTLDRRLREQPLSAQERNRVIEVIDGKGPLMAKGVDDRLVSLGLLAKDGADAVVPTALAERSARDRTGAFRLAHLDERGELAGSSVKPMDWHRVPAGADGVADYHALGREGLRYTIETKGPVVTAIAASENGAAERLDHADASKAVTGSLSAAMKVVEAFDRDAWDGRSVPDADLSDSARRMVRLADRDTAGPDASREATPIPPARETAAVKPGEVLPVAETGRASAKDALLRMDEAALKRTYEATRDAFKEESRSPAPDAERLKDLDRGIKMAKEVATTRNLRLESARPDPAPAASPASTKSAEPTVPVRKKAPRRERDQGM